MGHSRPKPCGCSSNAFLSGDVCGAAHGRRTLLSAFTAHVGSSGGTAGPVSGGLRRRRPPEPSSERHRPPLHSQVCRSRPAWLTGQRLSFPSSARTGTPPAEGVGGARRWNTHDGSGAPSTFASAFDVLRRRDEFLGAAGGGLRIRQPVSEPQFCRHCVAGSYRDKKRL